jgi:acetolactate synthase I/II/III large subunit
LPPVSAETISTGEAIVRALVREGVDTVFGIPGVQTYELFDALGRASDRIRVVAPRHEQAASYMALGYAKATGRTGVYSVVPGPGVLNSSAGLCTAYGASAPVLCLTSEVPTPYIGVGLGHLHELPDQLGTLRMLTKWAQRIGHPAEAPGLVTEALRRAASGRPRPVALETPWDVLSVRAPVDADAGAAATGEPAAAVDLNAVDRLAELLAGARHPMIMVGSGAQHAGAEVLAVAEHLQAPVVSFRSGRGIVSNEHHLGLTNAEGFELWAQTDVVLGIGSRMELAWFRWPDRPDGLKVATIDVDPTQHTRLGSALGVTADAAIAASLLAQALGQRGRPRPSRADELNGVKAQVAARVAEITPHAQFLGAIRDVLPRDGFLVEEICQAGFAATYALPFYEPRTFVSGGHQGTLGFGFPTALGVKVAHPDRAVVSLTGDGGFQFGLQELATAAQERIGVVTVLFDNNAYGNVLRDQHRLYEGREVASRLHNPDWLALADAYGVAGYRATTPGELGVALEGALAAGGPALVHVPVDPARERSPWPLLMPASRRTR